jgi:Fur family ferric uptake transcriptional regulator
MGHEHHLEEVRDELRTVLRGHSLRATAPRLAVLVTLHERGAPMTHEQIMETLPRGQYDKASVWRLLSDLAEAGVLRRMDLGDRVWRYELLDDCRPVDADHAHFLCEVCGIVSCLPPLVLRASEGQLPPVLQGADFRLKVTGTCAECVSA